MQLTEADKQAARQLVAMMQAVVSTVREMGPQGAPSGVVYAALSTKGMTVDFYNTMISKLQDLGVLRLSNNVLFYVEAR